MIIEKYYSVPPQTVEGKENCLKIPRVTFKSLTKFHKVVDNEVVEMNQSEKDAIVAAEVQAQQDSEDAKIASINSKITGIDIEEIAMPNTDSEIDAIQNFADTRSFLKKLIRYIAKYA